MRKFARINDANLISSVLTDSFLGIMWLRWHIYNPTINHIIRSYGDKRPDTPSSCCAYIWCMTGFFLALTHFLFPPGKLDRLNFTIAMC